MSATSRVAAASRDVGGAAPSGGAAYAVGSADAGGAAASGADPLPPAAYVAALLALPAMWPARVAVLLGLRRGADSDRLFEEGGRADGGSGGRRDPEEALGPGPVGAGRRRTGAGPPDQPRG